MLVSLLIFYHMRNKIATNTSAFKNLIESVPEISSGKRWFITSEDDQKWLIELIINKPTTIIPNSKCGFISFEGKKYLIITYFIFNEFNETEIEKIDVNAGIFTVLLAERFLTLKKDINENEFINKVDLSKESYEEYKGHDFEDILHYFEKINIFEINPNFIINNDNLYQIVGYLCTRYFKQNIFLPFDIITLEYFEQIFLEPELHHLSYDNILASLLSVNFKNAFLELYRNIEKLYPIPYIYNLHKTIGGNLNFHTFWSQIKEELKWRHKEEDAFRKLVCEMEESHRVILNGIFDDSPQPDITKLIYERIRNKIVHLEFSQENVEFEDAQWNKILEFCLLMNLHLYRKYSPILYRPLEKKTITNLGIKSRMNEINDNFSIIIFKNSTVPYSNSSFYTTCQDNQTSIKIRIYKGESNLCVNNYQIGEFVINDLPAKLAGVLRINVSFALDSNGNLIVIAKCIDNGIQEAETYNINHLIF